MRHMKRPSALRISHRIVPSSSPPSRGSTTCQRIVPPSSPSPKLRISQRLVPSSSPPSSAGSICQRMSPLPASISDTGPSGFAITTSAVDAPAGSSCAMHPVDMKRSAMPLQAVFTMLPPPWRASLARPLTVVNGRPAGGHGQFGGVRWAIRRREHRVARRPNRNRSSLEPGATSFGVTTARGRRVRAHRWTIRSWMLALVGLTASLGGCAAYYDPYGVDDGYGAYGYDDDLDVYAYPGYGYPYDGYRDPFAYRAPFIGPYGDPGAFPYGYPFPPVR